MAINGREYGSTGPTAPGVETSGSSSSKALNLGKVFGVMFIMLLFTAGISIGLSALFNSWLGSGASVTTAKGVYLGIMIGSGIGLIILTFIIQYLCLTQGKGMIVCSTLYVLFMSVLCSSMTLWLDWWLLGVALGITTAIFGVLSVIGLLAKRVGPLAMVGLMLIIGGGMTALITWLVILIGGARISSNMVMLLWIIDFAIFAGMLLMIIVDMYNIKKICERGEVTTNLTLYCALTLYTDFIYIFIKIAYYLAIAYGKR